MMRRHPGILSSRAAAQRRVAPVRRSFLNYNGNHPKGRTGSSPSRMTRCLGLFVVALVLLAVSSLRAFQSSASPDTSHGTITPTNSRRISLPAEAVPTSVDLAKSGLNSIDAVRQEFYRRYGGKEQAEAFLTKSIELYGDLDVTAGRLLRAKVHHNATFVVAFGGYSVTVGRGNHFHESFPFVMERLMRQPLQDALEIDLVVRNAAIGGIPSFPYGFCMPHFLGVDADVISWDYGMNEGGGASILESYVRHGLSQLPKRPMLLMLDTNDARSKLLRAYHDQNLLPDAIRVARGKDVVDKSLLDLPDASRPDGLKEWDEFGAPKTCPGRSSWHPKKKEHEFIGWMIAMHFVKAIERAQEIIDEDESWEAHHAMEIPLQPFPSLVNTNPPSNPEPVMELLYGHRDGRMGDISCRTSFQPAVDQDKILPSIVVSGMTDGIASIDIMEERNDDLYRQGWVLDVSKVERDTKKKVEKCGGLGYIDMKVALYGIPESGTLQLWLPYEGTTSPDTEDARKWFDDLIVCEANEKRKEEACQLNSDVSYVVGGIEVPAKSVAHVDGAGVYLNRKTCVHVGVPEGARITRLGGLAAGLLSADEKRRLSGPRVNDRNVGLLVNLTAHAGVSRANGACCISHVIWEQGYR